VGDFSKFPVISYEAQTLACASLINRAGDFKGRRPLLLWDYPEREKIG